MTYNVATDIARGIKFSSRHYHGSVNRQKDAKIGGQAIVLTEDYYDIR
jgi:hypothetical protein